MRRCYGQRTTGGGGGGSGMWRSRLLKHSSAQAISHQFHPQVWERLDSSLPCHKEPVLPAATTSTGPQPRFNPTSPSQYDLELHPPAPPPGNTYSDQLNQSEPSNVQEE